MKKLLKGSIQYIYFNICTFQHGWILRLSRPSEIRQKRSGELYAFTHIWDKELKTTNNKIKNKQNWRTV